MTLEEHNERLMEYMDSLMNLHAHEECPEDCLFCVREAALEYAPLEVLVDTLLESHKGHPKKDGYPFLGCEYCQAEKMMSRYNQVRRVFSYE